MNDVMVQMPDTTGTSFRMNMLQGTAQLEGSPENGAFSQLLMMLVGGMPEEEFENNFIERLLFPSENDHPENETDVNTDAMQMAAMLLQSGQITPEMFENFQELLQSGSTQGKVDGMTMLPGTAVPVTQGTEGVQLPSEFAVSPQAMESAGKPSEDSPLFALPKDAVVSANVQPEGEENTSLTDQVKYSQSMAEVHKTLKDQMKSDSKDQQPAEIDIEALQQKVNANRTGNNLPAANVSKDSFPPELKTDVANQMKNHILQNLSDGKDEFVVKLKPENLGEIVVKMQEKDGHISLSIITASTQTAKLLNEASEALKSSLRPLQAEVREIIARPEQPQSSAESNFMNHSFDSFQQQQQQFAHHNQQFQTYSAHTDFTDSLFDEIMDAEELIESMEGLDTYV